ncbi:MAG: HAD family hydrolase [Thermaurantimonas sp.]
MKSIKNLIWDFGVVLIDLDFKRFQELCEAYGMKADVNILNTHFSHVFEKGLITEHEFLRESKLLFPGWVSYPTIKSIWNSMLGTIPDEKIRLLYKIQKSGYNQVLCSNTNETHIRHIWEKHGIYTSRRFQRAFSRIFLSYKCAMRKPEPEFFLFILDEMGWHAEETLLVDDNQQNIDSASTLGMHVLHYTSPRSFKYFDTALPMLHVHRADEQNR